jgi:hypothetical protein
MRQSWFGKALISGLYLAGCASGSGPGGQEDETPEAARGQAIIGIAPLTFEGATNVCWRVTVTNGPQRTGEIVWQMDSVCADEFGDERGGIAYVGSCDATTGDNSVTIELLDIYTDPNGNTSRVDPSEYQNPCGLVENWTDVETRVLKDGEDPYPLCTRNVICLENKDTPVAFDVTVVRDANQGFFDIAVRFDEIFCSAKLDTCTVDEDGKQTPIELLFDAEGEPAPTAVLALACSAQPGEDVNTILHMSSVTLDCPPPFEDIHLDPSAGDGGNVWRFDGSPADPNPEDAVIQYAVYEDTELLECGGESCNKRFWSLAIGLDPTRLPSGCYIRATATTTDGGFPDEAGEPTGRFPDRGGYALISYATRITKSGGELACVQDGLNDGGGVSVVFPEPTAKCAPDFCYFQDASGTWNDRAAPKTLENALGGVSEWCEGGRVPVRELVSADTLCAAAIGQCCLEVWKEAATKQGLLDSNGCATADPAEWAISNIPKVPSLAWCNAPTGYDFPVSFGPSDIDFEPTEACAPLELDNASLESALDASGGLSYCGVGDLEACLPRDERLVLASVETYLKYAEAMGLTQQGASVSDNVQGYFSVETGLKLLEALGGTARWIQTDSGWMPDPGTGIDPRRLVGVASVETYLKLAEAIGMVMAPLDHDHEPIVQVMASVETYLKFAEAVTSIPAPVYRSLFASVETYLKYAEAVGEGNSQVGFASVETTLKYAEALDDYSWQKLIASVETYLKHAEASGGGEGGVTVGVDFPIASVETYLKYAEATETASAMRLGLVSSIETWAKYAEAIDQSPCKDPGSRHFQAFSNFNRFKLLAEVLGLDSQTYFDLAYDYGEAGQNWLDLASMLGNPGLTLRNNYDANLRPNYGEDPDTGAPGAATAGLVGLASSGALLSWGDYSGVLQRRVLDKGLVQCRDEDALVDLTNHFNEEGVDRILDKGVVSGVRVRRILEALTPWGEPNPSSTTVSADSDGVSLPVDTVYVASTEGFPPSGRIRVQVRREGNLEWETFYYESLTPTSFSLAVERWYWGWWMSATLEEGLVVVDATNSTPAEVVDRILDKGIVASESFTFDEVLSVLTGVTAEGSSIAEIADRILDKGIVSSDLSPFEILDLVGLVYDAGSRSSEAEVLDRVLDKGVIVKALPVSSVFELAKSLGSSTSTLAEALGTRAEIFDRLVDKGMVADLVHDADIGPISIIGGFGQKGEANPRTTTVAAESDGVNLPATTLHVSSTAGFPPSGSLRVQVRREGRLSWQGLRYDSLTPTSFNIPPTDWEIWGVLEEGLLVMDASASSPAEVIDRILDKGMVTHGPLSLAAIRGYIENIISPSDTTSFAEVMDRILDKGAFVLQGDENFSNLTAFGVGANSGLETNGRILDKGIVIDGLNSRASDFELFRELQHIFAGMSPEQVQQLLDKGIVIERIDGCIRIMTIEDYLKWAEAVGGPVPA